MDAPTFLFVRVRRRLYSRYYTPNNRSFDKGPHARYRKRQLLGGGRSETCRFWGSCPSYKNTKNTAKQTLFTFGGIPIYIYITKVKSLFSVVFFVSSVRSRRLRIRHFTGGEGECRCNIWNQRNGSYKTYWRMFFI